MITSIDMFAYLAAFISVVLALALSDLVQSFHRLLRARRRVKWSLTALIAAATVFMMDVPTVDFESRRKDASIEVSLEAERKRRFRWRFADHQALLPTSPIHR